MENTYDLIIIGAGPAGLTSAIYATRYALKTLVIGELVGGQTTEVGLIENYPGIPNVSGLDLAQKMFDQAKSLGMEFVGESVAKIEKVDLGFKVATVTGKEFVGKTIILTCGTEPKRLNVPGEVKFRGRGVSYCVTCDGPLFRGKTVAVVGGGDSALMGALELAGYVDRVYLLVRSDVFRAKPYLVELAKNNPKINISMGINITSVNGLAKVESVTLDNPNLPNLLEDPERALASRRANTPNLPLDGLFVEIGSTPATTLTQILGLKTDEFHFVEVGADQSTSVTGVFAAGDLTTGSNRMRQIVTAVGEAAVAAQSAYHYLQSTTTPTSLTSPSQKSPLRISVDPAKCVGCGICVTLAPNTFELDPATGISKVKNLTGDALDKIKQAAASCPEGAITIIG